MQSDSNVAFGKQISKVFFGHFDQNFTNTLMRGRTASLAHANIQIDKGVIFRAPMRIAVKHGSLSPASTAIGNRVEVELAFVLKKDLQGPNVTVAEVLAATEYVTPAIEIIDARIEQFDRDTKVMRKVFDTISDNAANAGIVVGAEKVDPLTTNLPWCGSILKLNGVVEETGLAAGVQGHPAVGIAWLANKLAPWGEHLKAGQIVLAGSFTKPVPAKVGDVFDADYGALGRLQFKFI